jgi:hypothetical protein
MAQYVPILKARVAEFAALAAAPTTLDVMPVFELQRELAPTPKQDGSISRKPSSSGSAARFLDDIRQQWTGGSVMVDVSRVAQGGNEASWWRLLAALEQIDPCGAKLAPVVHVYDPPAAVAEAAHLAAASQDVAVRIPMPAAANPASAVLAVSGATTVPLAQMTVILDWADRLTRNGPLLDDAVTATLRVITALPAGVGRVVIAGTPAVPGGLQDGHWDFTRREWWVWLRVHAVRPDIVFGDYAGFAPANPGGRGPRYGHLRYSSGSDLHVCRDRVPRTGGGLSAAFGEVCKQVVKAPWFLGGAFSSYDQQIVDAAGGQSTGDSTEWRRIGVGHHLHVVDDQLRNLPPAPVAGTR